MLYTWPTVVRIAFVTNCYYVCDNLSDLWPLQPSSNLQASFQRIPTTRPKLVNAGTARTQPAAEQLDPHGDVAVPAPRVDANVLSSDGRAESVRHHKIPLTVSWEYLSGGNNVYSVGTFRRYFLAGDPVLRPPSVHNII